VTAAQKGRPFAAASAAWFDAVLVFVALFCSEERLLWRKMRRLTGRRPRE
jgi:hypothetical protein